jgi:hypothetical protein
VMSCMENTFLEGAGLGDWSLTGAGQRQCLGVCVFKARSEFCRR